jgi:hypothetical protein
MNLREGTRRLALFLGTVGAILGGFASYLELQSVLSQRTRHNAFQSLAGSDSKDIALLILRELAQGGNRFFRSVGKGQGPRLPFPLHNYRQGQCRQEERMSLPSGVDEPCPSRS